MAPEARPLLRAHGLSKSYRRAGARGDVVNALVEVDVAVARGQTLAVVGRSGSGKSTLARCLARLEEPGSGEIWLDDVDVGRLRGRALLPFRERVQLVFQDAATSLSPRLVAADLVAEPLAVLGRGTAAERRARALQLMQRVGLPPELAARTARQMSGGQRQRLALARALALDPALLVLDEPFSGLDGPVQAQIAQLLLRLQASEGLAYVCISHDLALMSGLAGNLAVMHEGRVVEQGSTRELLAAPRHAATRALLEAIPPLAREARA